MSPDWTALGGAERTSELASQGRCRVPVGSRPTDAEGAPGDDIIAGPEVSTFLPRPGRGRIHLRHDYCRRGYPISSVNRMSRTRKGGQILCGTEAGLANIRVSTRAPAKIVEERT